MFNYVGWLQRLASFLDALSKLPGQISVKCLIDPPLRLERLKELTIARPQPIPFALKELWLKGSCQIDCQYSWVIPDERLKQKELIFPHWPASHIWGGFQILSVDEVLNWSNAWRGIGDFFRRDGYKVDAEYWEQSIGLIPAGNGDYVGLRPSSNEIDASVVYLCHEGSNVSQVVSPDLEAFLTNWELVGFIGIHFVMSFIDPSTGLFDPSAFPVRRDALQELLRPEQ